MARTKKKPAYDSAQMAKQIIEAITDAYLNPPQGYIHQSLYKRQIERFLAGLIGGHRRISLKGS